MLACPSLYLDVVATAAGRLEISPQYLRNVVKKERNSMSGLITGLVLLALGALYLWWEARSVGGHRLADT